VREISEIWHSHGAYCTSPFAIVVLEEEQVSDKDDENQEDEESMINELYP
jgi:hypothetical protein